MVQLLDTTLLGDANIVSYYKLDGNANDEKGTNNGTGTDMTYSAANGKFGQGGIFNGSTSRIQANDSASLSITGNYTFNLWINPDTLPTSGNFMSFLCKYDVVAAVNSGWDFRLYNNSGTQEIDLIHGNNTDNPTATYITTLPTGVWTMLTGVYNGSTLKIYVNAVERASTNTAINPADNAKKLNIGNFGLYTPSGPAELGRYFDGNLDDISIFNRALTVGEILTLYKDTLQGYSFFM